MENRVIRVAQVIGIAAAGGVESMIMNLYKNIDRTKVQFDFLVENTCPIIDKVKIEELGGRIIIIPTYTTPFKFIKALKEIFKKEKYDIVHSNMNALSVFVLYAAKKAGIKTRIAHSHSTANKKEFKKNAIKNILRPFSKIYATHYFACSEFAGRWLFGNKTFEKGKVTIINNAIDIENFKFNQEKREEIRKGLNLNDSFVVGHVGRFMRQKNHEFLLDIFNCLLQKHHNSYLMLIGDGELKSAIEEKTKSLNINDRVLFLGIKKNVYDYYNCFDCFVLPSLYEGLPVVLVEAQANGVPCFFADTITKEALVSNNSQILSLSTSASEWGDIIYENSFALSQRNQDLDKIYSKFDIKNEAKELLSYYIDILRNNI